MLDSLLNQNKSPFYKPVCPCNQSIQVELRSFLFSVPLDKFTIGLVESAHALGTEQVASSSPGSVGYVSRVHRAYRLLGSLRGSLSSYGLIHKLCLKKLKINEL